jgi:replicative DNA helicase
MEVEDKVELEKPQENMQRINLFESDEELSKYLPLGLNKDYDKEILFSPRDYILIGGRRGVGKSITCANVAHNVYEGGKTAIYYTIEMDQRSVLQRVCSISTGIPFSRLRSKNLSITEWEQIASWWAHRFEEGQERLKEYKAHRDFNRFHHSLVTNCALHPTQQLDVVYDPSLTISRLQADLDKKIKSKMDVGIIIVDYLNQVKRTGITRRGGQYDWAEQIEVSKSLKSIAQEYETTLLSPYQTDAQGEARFAKGILDSADAAFTLETWSQQDQCITFNNVKMRAASMKGFTSSMNWETLKIGPDTALTPEERESMSSKTGEDIHDI